MLKESTLLREQNRRIHINLNQLEVNIWIDIFQ